MRKKPSEGSWLVRTGKHNIMVAFHQVSGDIYVVGDEESVYAYVNDHMDEMPKVKCDWLMNYFRLCATHRVPSC